MKLFLFVYLLPLTSCLKGKEELKQCNEGIFMKNASRQSHAPIVKKAGRGCVMSLVWEQTPRTINTGDPKNPHRTKMQCKANTLWGEVRAAVYDSELTKKFHDAEDTTSGKLEVDEIYYGDEIELEEDRLRRLEAEKNGSVTARTTVSTTTEKSPIERYCILFSKDNRGNMTCWCFTDLCNSIESNFVMAWIKGECARSRRVGETEKEYKAACGDDELDAVSCLQPVMEAGLQVTRQPNIRRVHDAVNKDPDYGQPNGTSLTFSDEDDNLEEAEASALAQNGDKSKDGSKTALIVGVCVGVAVFVLLAAVAGTIFYFVMRRRRRQQEELLEETSGGEEPSEAGDEPSVSMTGSTSVARTMEPSGLQTVTLVKEETTGAETKIKSDEPSTEGLKEIFKKIKTGKKTTENGEELAENSSFDKGDRSQEKRGQEKPKGPQKPQKKGQVNKKSGQKRTSKKRNVKKGRRGTSKGKKSKSKPKAKKSPATKKTKSKPKRK